MNVSLTRELERVVNEKVKSGLYQTASELVREALRLLKERDRAREQLPADVQAGFDQLARGEGRAYVRSEFGKGVRSFAVESYVIYYRHEATSRSQRAKIDGRCRRACGSALERGAS